MPYKNIEDRRACARRSEAKIRKEGGEELRKLRAKKALEYYRANQEEITKKRRERRKNNPEQYEREKKKDTLALRNSKRRMKQRLVDYFGGKCHHCEIEDNGCIYDFHHLDPPLKDSTISVLITLTRDFDVILAEAKKCIMVCANCHRKIHRGLI